MKTAVGYVRYSSDNQREESIDAQIRAINKYCLENGIEILRIYEDHALTARSDDRPSFLKMIKESSVLEYDYVIVHKLDRFSRNRYDSAIHKKTLKSNGKTLISVLERLDDSPESIIIEALYEALAEYYSANLAREVMKGMSENAYKAKFNGGTRTFGYQIDSNKDYVVDELEATAVKLIYSMYAKDEKIKDILYLINQKGIKSTTGKPFTYATLNRILKNDKYIGTYTFGDIVVENAIPAILSKELFQEVQMKRKNRSLKPSKGAKYIYLLSGMLKCADGKDMIGESATSKTGRIYRYYRCPSCKIRVRADIIEDKLIKAIQATIFHSDNINTIIDLMYAYYQDSSNMSAIQGLKNRIQQLNRQINNLVDAIANGGSNKILLDRLTAIEKEKEDLENTLTEQKLKFKPLTKNEIKSFVEKHKDLNKFTKKELKTILKFFIESITLKDNCLVITLPVKDLSSCNISSGGPSGTRTQDLPVMSRAL